LDSIAAYLALLTRNALLCYLFIRQRAQNLSNHYIRLLIFVWVEDKGIQDGTGMSSMMMSGFAA